MKQIVIIKHIHSCFASFAGGDALLYLTLSELDFTITGGVIKSKNFPILNDEEISSSEENKYVITIYLKADKTIYYKAINSQKSTLTYKDDETFNSIVKKYTDAGFTEIRPDILKAIDIKKDLANKLERELNGNVIIDWSPDLKPEDYKGALSDGLFNTPYLKEYLEKGGCHGYIGSSSRTFDIDRFFEQTLKEEGYDNLDIAIFMCGRDGRHLSDQFPNNVNKENSAQLKVDILDYMKSAERWISQEKQEIQNLIKS
jgi:hypothetical protein